MDRILTVSALLVLLVAAPAFADPPVAPAFSKAILPRDWSFPRDHGRHDDFKTEWWYFTGNLTDNAGRPFGYQITFFRTSLVADKVDRPSPWALHDLYFAHAAISDIAGQSFVFKDCLSRQHAGLAEASDQTLDVKLLGWSARLSADGIHLIAVDNDLAIDLLCAAGRGPVFQGPGGVNLKGNDRDQASYYYSMTRLPTSGALTVGGKTYKVAGRTWMDHEFSSNALGPQQVGWDWMGLSLADGNDLMIYRMRRRDGSSDYLSGTVIDTQGRPRYLSASDITLTPSEPWISSSTGASYPQRWKMTVNGIGDFAVVSRMPGQELITGTSTKIDYFEGAAQVLDPQGRAIGDGYLEMTGYGKSIGGF